MAEIQQNKKYRTLYSPHVESSEYDIWFFKYQTKNKLETPKIDTNGSYFWSSIEAFLITFDLVFHFTCNSKQSRSTRYRFVNPSSQFQIIYS